MNRLLLALLGIAAASAIARGQTSAPVTLIRDTAWSADPSAIVSPGAGSAKCAARLANMSVRAVAGSGANNIIAGATVQGTGDLPVLVRAVGPGLAQFGVSSALRGVNLSIYRGTSLLAQTNTTGPNVAASCRTVGSFPLREATSTTAGDAALAGWVSAGAVSAYCNPTLETKGTGLVEFYDATTVPTAGSSRFVNLSARARVESGDGLIVIGFVVVGDGQLTLLLRGIGPSLQQFRLTDTLRDPTIELYAGATRLATNNDWRDGDTATQQRLEAARAAVGAFGLTSTSDAALLVSLPAGAYTLLVHGTGNDTGIALAEIYEVARTNYDPPPARIQLPAGNRIAYTDAGTTGIGTWQADITATPSVWTPGAPLNLQATMRFPTAYFDALKAKNIIPDSFVLLVTAERVFDADGILRLPSDERMSSLLTPTRLPIEGGVQGAVTKRFGYRFRTPVDELVTVPLAATEETAAGRTVTFNVATKLPDDLPPGIYRLRLDYGTAVKTRRYNLNSDTFATRGFPTGPCDTETYSPPILANSRHASGKVIDAAKIKPRVPWVLFNGYNSNGYRGAVAEEDQTHFALSSRNLIQDDVILPRYSESSPTSAITYSLEPQFPTDTIFTRQNIPWDPTKGEITAKITQPDGKVLDLGTAPFVAASGSWPTTRNSKFTAWKPAMYGLYTARVTGWLQDIWGNRYEGGGTYQFWIAKRMTLATATFQGQSYPVGNRLGRDIGFAPAVPADVNITATLFVNSDPANIRTITCAGKATAGGMFGAAQGLKPLNFDAPGEYSSHLFATYTDADSHLWVQSMRHSGVIYPLDSPIVAHGKMLSAQGKLVERGETRTEGWVESTGIQHLEHINFPYNAGDVLLIATEQQYANKIEPVLTWAAKTNPAPYDSSLQTIGYTNVRIQTSNGYSPHLFPEYITDLQYYYASAPRPGFMGRFLVGEDGVRAPYWQLSPQNFGGQVGTSNNGDAPGEIYRLLGGVVLRNQGQTPVYAGYMATALTLPPGTKNNRVIAPGTEDLRSATGQTARIFLAMNARPGIVYVQGTTFTPAFQIDPMLPVNMEFTLGYPDGREVAARGTGDASGSWAGSTPWPLDVPGVYRYTVTGEWNGHHAVVPGLPMWGGLIFVIDKDRPANAPNLAFTLPPISRFDAVRGTKFTGTSTASTVFYASVMPGAVLAQGSLPVTGGKFEYTFDPIAINQTTPAYETINAISKAPELGRVVHLTFFSQEKAPDGKAYGSFVRLVIRGNTVHYTR